MSRPGCVLLAAVIGAVVAGCGEKAAETIAEKAMESEGGQADVDIRGDSAVVRTESGDIAIGSAAKIPDDFPKDVPLYPNLTPNVVSSIAREGSYSLQGEVKAGMAEVAEYYKKEALAQGWEQRQLVEQPQFVMLTYEKGERALNVMINTEGGTTMLIVTVANK